MKGRFYPPRCPALPPTGRPSPILLSLKHFKLASGNVSGLFHPWFCLDKQDRSALFVFESKTALSIYLA
jgi:hypothetical protein